MSKSKTEVPEGVSYLTIRGTTYRIEELDNGTYEDVQRQAEVPAEDGDGTVTDMLMLNKLVTMLAVTIVEKEGDGPGRPLDPEEWRREKAPVTARVQLAVRQAHFMALTDEEKATAEKKNAKKGADPND